MAKRLLSIVTALLMAMALIPMHALAEAAPETVSGRDPEEETVTYVEAAGEIADGETFLIGYTDGTDVWLLMNTNPDNGSHYASGYEGYGLQAEAAEGVVTGFNGVDAVNLEWEFASTDAGLRYITGNGMYLGASMYSTDNDLVIRDYSGGNNNVWAFDGWVMDGDGLHITYNGLTRYLAVTSAHRFVSALSEEELATVSGIKLYKKTAGTPDPTGEPGAGPAWDFENDPEADGWEFVDSDGDGHNWHWETDPDACEPHGGEGVLMSESYDNSAYTPLNADNWAFSPAVSISGPEAPVIKLWYKGLDPSYPSEHFMVYAGAEKNVETMVPISDEIVATEEFQELSVTTNGSGVYGDPIYFAIRHFNSSDQFAIEIDDISTEGLSAYAAPIMITEANVNGFSIPTAGDLVDDYLDGSVEEGHGYYLQNVFWNDCDIQDVLYSGSLFESGGHYEKGFSLRAEEGYAFSPDCVITIDGSTEYLNAEETSILNPISGYSFAAVFSVTITPNEPSVEPTPVPGLNELDAALNAPGGDIHFENVASYDWIVVEEDGRVYAKSGNAGVANSTSSIETHVTIGEGGGTVSFDYMACGETATYGSSIYDHCYFLIDGSQIFNKGNEESLGWQNYIISLSPGEHTLRWYYSKDGSVNSPQDCFKLDNVAITGEEVVEPTPTPVPVDPDELDTALNVEGGTIHFENDASYPWTVETDGDRVYAKSGNAGVHETTSTITANVTVEGEGMMIRFDLIARGEGYDSVDWDNCRFYVDGEMVMKYGAHDEEWESFEWSLTPGEHELKWQYKKDHSTHPDGDYFAVDNVEILEGTPVLPEEITEIRIYGFSVPVWGMHPDYELEIPEDAPYSIREVFWYYANPYDEDYGTLTEDEYFDSELCTYDMVVRLDAAEGYVFAEQIDVYINDRTSLVGSHSIALEGYYYVYSREYEVDPSVVTPTEEPVEPVGPIWDFETDPEAQGWTFIDQDGDGSNWEWVLDWYGEYSFHEGDGFMTSYSYDNEAGAALTPDNWAVTPEFTVPEDGVIALWAQGQDPDWPYEIFGLYIRTVGDKGEWVQIGDDEMTWGTDLRYDFDISEYAGQTVQAAVRHYNITDMFEINVDYVFVTSGPLDPVPEPEAIHEIHVDGYEPPVAGEYSGDHLALTVPEGANYHICMEGYNAPCWWNNDPDVDNVFEGVFAEGTPYSVGMTVIAEDGYCFADDCVVYINGATEIVDPTYTGIDEDDFTLCYVWTMPEEAVSGGGAELIHDVWVTGFESPAAGELAIDHMNLTTPADAPYFIVYGGWLDETDQQQLWQEDAVFVAGHVYSEGCQIWADDGYEFAPDCVFHIEGAELDTEWSYVDPDDAWICYVNSVPVTCGGSGVLLGDADGDGDVDIQDALLIMRYAQALISGDDIDVEVCDVNMDGEINFIDALLVLRRAMGLIPALPLR